ncbi:uncharacterized protein [Blastocystis hominis]|uniref:Uncharacterized protein n=1 Tax=Blastocystis hominis TaxID=12968 RepID=D8LXF4_BLAHO|nr:uncharacterized protein [Blastocystis hominis]CBK20949.2 unnamed protein product [Blastocystis hominis]|eukprot:XP_012894997.1 uncharacterized protein [Blastocystis hominis]
MNTSSIKLFLIVTLCVNLWISLKNCTTSANYPGLHVLMGLLPIRQQVQKAESVSREITAAPIEDVTMSNNQTLSSIVGKSGFSPSDSVSHVFFLCLCKPRALALHIPLASQYSHGSNKT